MTERPAFALPDRTTIVSGLPRSGTSLLMQMLEAAGLPLARDDGRPPDPDNPRGYHELAAVKRLRADAGFLADCRGRVVKIVAPLVLDVPPASIGRILFVERDLEEVLASQRAMLLRQAPSLATATAAASPSVDAGDDEGLRRAFAAALETTRAWLRRTVDDRVLIVDHRRLIHAPDEGARRIAQFLERTARIEGPTGSPAPRPADGRRALPDAGIEAVVHAMAAVVEPALHRQRGGPRR